MDSLFSDFDTFLQRFQPKPPMLQPEQSPPQLALQEIQNPEGQSIIEIVGSEPKFEKSGVDEEIAESRQTTGSSNLIMLTSEELFGKLIKSNPMWVGFAASPRHLAKKTG
jgi:hypothetical protein